MANDFCINCSGAASVPESLIHPLRDFTLNVVIVGKVLENSPPTRLAFSWARPGDMDDGSKHSKVTFDIEPYTDVLVRLTVTHDELDEAMLKGVSGGWPTILSNLKTFLETGQPLPHTAPH